MRLEEVCQIQSGLTVKTRLSVSVFSGVSAIRLQDIKSNGTVDLDNLANVYLPKVPEIYIARAGDVVFRSRGSWNTAAVIPKEFDSFAVAVMPVLILRTVPSIVSPEYIAWLINRPSSQHYFRRITLKSTIPMIPRTYLANFEVEVPDMKTQELVVRTVALVEERSNVLSKLNRLSRAQEHRRLEMIARSQSQNFRRGHRES